MAHDFAIRWPVSGWGKSDVSDKIHDHAVPPLTKAATLTVVVPCYNERGNVQRLIQEALRFAEGDRLGGCVC